MHDWLQGLHCGVRCESTGEEPRLAWCQRSYWRHFVELALQCAGHHFGEPPVSRGVVLYGLQGADVAARFGGIALQQR